MPHRRLPRFALCAAALALASALASGAPTAPADWHTQATSRKLTPAQIERLERDSFVVTPQTLPRAFEALKGGQEPAFLSSDIALEAFHALLSDSMEALAVTRREPLAAYLGTLWKTTNSFAASLVADPVGQRSLRHLRLTLGPALVLLGQPLDGVSAEERTAIDAEVQRIRTGQAAEPSTWLAPASGDPSLAAQERIDYAGMSPIGFYTRTPELADLFRATRWLQSVPFRARIDHEALAAVLLESRSETTPLPPALAVWFKLLAPYRSPAVSDIIVSKDFKSAAASDLTAAARKILEGRAAFEIDPARRHRAGKEAEPDRLVLHILPAGLAADQDALNEAAAATQRSDAMPTGLIVADWLGFAEAAPLAHAAGWITPKRPWVPEPSNVSRDDEDIRNWNNEMAIRGEVLNARTVSIAAALQPTPHEHLLALWRSLAQPPAPWAPDFMRRTAWQWKSTNTALASWALTRRAFALEQPDCFAMDLGIDDPPPLIVEPAPDSWSAFRTVVEVFEQRFRQAEILRPYSGAELDEACSAWNSGDHSALGRLYLADRWSALLKVARSTERLCLRQGAHLPADAEDEHLVSFLYDSLFFATTGLGGGFMGASGAIPPDLAPQVVPVWSNPTTRATLHAAVGRPRWMWMLYPWEGRPVLCRSAVLTYHEFVEPDGHRVTDAEWKARLDSKTPPPQPVWLQPLFGP
jgi:hypothetical protein